MRGVLVLSVVLSLVCLAASQAPAACGANQFGADCSCTKDMSEWATFTPVCANATWTLSSPSQHLIVASGKTFDVGFDTVIVNSAMTFESGSRFNTLNIFTNETTNTTNTVTEKFGVLKVANTFQLTFNGTFFLTFEAGDPGLWDAVYMFYDPAVPVIRPAAPEFGSNFTNGYSNCRELDPTLQTGWTGGEVWIRFLILKTSDICQFSKGERTWVYQVMIAAGATMVGLCVFALVTCLVPFFKRKLWYPPEL